MADQPLLFFDPLGFFPNEGFGGLSAKTGVRLNGDPTVFIDTEVDMSDVASTDQGKVDFIVFVDNMEFHNKDCNK